MATYKLNYFNARARAELSRMLFAAAEIPFDDNRIEFSKWPTVKGEMPQGTLPVLEIGETKITQSTSIARFLAREFNLYGEGNLEKAVVDQIFDTCVDMYGPFLKIILHQNVEEKAKLTEEYYKTSAGKYLGFLEALIKGGSEGYAVGTSLTLGDLALYVYIENIGAKDMLEKFPLLAENRKKIAGLPLIAKYLSNRPKTDF